MPEEVKYSGCRSRYRLRRFLMRMRRALNALSSVLLCTFDESTILVLSRGLSSGK